MTSVVPALLTDKKDDLQAMLKSCAGFTDFVQVDIMDGQFVPSASVSLKEMAEVRSFTRSEAHLMVKDPLDWVETFKTFGSERIIFHFEAVTDHAAVIKGIKKAGLRAGLAINPPTPIDDFRHLVKQVECILFMSVYPGFYGAKFVPEVLAKISAFKREHPDVIVGIDGGVKADNLNAVTASGVDFICVGSAILKAADPAQAYNGLLRDFTAARGAAR